jgi:hypothetical protein
MKRSKWRSGQERLTHSKGLMNLFFRYRRSPTGSYKTYRSYEINLMTGMSLGIYLVQVKCFLPQVVKSAQVMKKRGLPYLYRGE